MSDNRIGQFTELDPKSFVQGLFEESSTQKHKLGTKRSLSDGRVFVYGQAGGANIAAGVLCQGTASDVANAGNLAITANANIGAKELAVTLGNLLAAANLYAEGYVYISSATGGGYGYKIKSHPAAAANANLTLTLYDTVRANHTTSHKASLVRHPAKTVIIHPSPPTQSLLGATIIPVTANYFAWFQREGPAVVLIDGTVVAGDRVFASTSVDGSVQPSSGNAIDMVTEQFVGSVIVVNANTHYGLINLQL